MKQLPRISVIVPVYKAEQSLKQCVDSILAQTFTDFELILVDDGSPDNCPAICDQYKRTDSRVKVIHQENGGVSVARNTGIHHARGDCIVFVDSDDYIDSFYLDKLYKGYESGADIAICGYYTVCHNGPDLTYIDQTLPSEHIGKIKDVFKNILENDLLYSPCNKMFKTTVLRDKNILFDKNMALGEDLCFNIAYLYYCEKCFLCNVPLYYYVKANSTLSKSISLDYFNIQKHLYETIFHFIQSKQIDYDLSEKIESLLRDTLGNLSISKTQSKYIIYAKVKEIFRDRLIAKYLEKKSTNNISKNLLCFLLKIKSIFLVLAFFRIKHRVGKFFRGKDMVV